MVSKFPHCQGYSCCSCIFQPIRHIRSALAQSFNLHMTRTIWKKNNSPSPCHLKRNNIQKRHNWKEKCGPESTLHAYPALSTRVRHCHGVLASIFFLGAKIGTNVKISRRISKYSLFFGKKVAKLPKRRNTKTIHHILGLGFLSLLKNKLKKFGYVLKTCGHLMVNPSWEFGMATIDTTSQTCKNTRECLPCSKMGIQDDMVSSSTISMVSHSDLPICKFCICPKPINLGSSSTTRQRSIL